jgi:hypothetical protein
MNTSDSNLNVDLSSETFSVRKYNHCEVLVRDSDGYVNASKIISEYGLDMQTFLNTSRRPESEKSPLEKPYYTIGDTLYIHPSLTHHVLYFASPYYAAAVARMMNRLHSIYENDRPLELL